MMKSKIIFTVALISLLAMFGAKLAVAGGGGTPPVSNADLMKQLNDLKSRLNALETKKDKDIGALPVTVEKNPWCEKTVIKGDFRYRHEMIDSNRQTNGQTRKRYTQNRHRIRARLGIFSKVQDDLDVGFQLTTAQARNGSEGDLSSANQTLDGAFSKKSIWLDLAYVDWHPEAFQGVNTKGLHLIAGKMKDPFLHLTEMIFDPTITPEGGAMTYETELMPKTSVFANIGGFWVEEREGYLSETLRSNGLKNYSEDPHVDSMLWAFQTGIKTKCIEPLDITTGISFYNFTGVKHQRFLYDNTNNTGNSSALYNYPVPTAYEAYSKDYDIINPFVKIGFTVFDTPVAVYSDFAKNAIKNDGFGYAVGYQINKCDKPKSWHFIHEYRYVEPDAVVGAFADAFVGVTGYKGNKFCAKYQLTKSVDIGTSLYLMDIDTHAQLADHVVDRFDHGVPSFNRWEQYNRWMVDLNVKF